MIWYCSGFLEYVGIIIVMKLKLGNLGFVFVSRVCLVIVIICYFKSILLC